MWFWKFFSQIFIAKIFFFHSHPFVTLFCYSTNKREQSCHFLVLPTTCPNLSNGTAKL
jgi:hypothetical protein